MELYFLVKMKMQINQGKVNLTKINNSNERLGKLVRDCFLFTLNIFFI